MKILNRKIPLKKLLILVLVVVMPLTVSVQLVQANGVIYINADGTISPSTAPIQRDGNVYTLTGDIFGEIYVLKDNIELSGAGYTIDGTGTSTGSAGVRLWTINNVLLTDLKIKSFFYGIDMEWSSNNNIIVGNTITETYIGINLYQSSYNTISENYLSLNTAGVGVYWSDDNEVLQNEINNNNNGIMLQKSSGNDVSGNIIENNLNGICIAGSSENLIFGNSIMNSEKGFFIFDSFSTPSSLNSIFENTVAGHDVGVYLQDSPGNLFYHNHFISNIIQVQCWSITAWDDGYPSGGNFWSDYTGDDLYNGVNQDVVGSDGIGDTAKVIDYVGGEDEYPLMSTFYLQNIKTEIVNLDASAFRNPKIADKQRSLLVSQIDLMITKLEQDSYGSVAKMLKGFSKMTEMMLIDVENIVHMIGQTSSLIDALQTYL